MTLVQTLTTERINSTEGFVPDKPSTAVALPLKEARTENFHEAQRNLLWTWQKKGFYGLWRFGRLVAAVMLILAYEQDMCTFPCKNRNAANGV